MAKISFEEKQMGLMVTGLLTRGTSMAFSAAQMGAMGAADHMKNSAINAGQKFGSGKASDKEGGDSGQKFPFQSENRKKRCVLRCSQDFR